MIGGCDLVMPTRAGASALDACARVILAYWPNAVFEDANSDARFASFAAIPFGQLKGLLVHRDAESAHEWTITSSETPACTLIYLILSADSITAVVDDAEAPALRPILDSIQRMLTSLDRHGLG